MNPDTNEQPLIPAFSPSPAFVGLRRGKKVEKENLCLVRQHASGLDLAGLRNHCLAARKSLQRSLILALISSVVFGAAISATAATVKILLPPETRSFKPGPNSELANGQCLVCHSVDYVTMQPPMPKTFWAASVKKMREKYGAQLPEEQVPALVDYLAKNYGMETNSMVVPTASSARQSSTPFPIHSDSPGEAVALRFACFGCHSVTNKLVGPPYKEVAAKYKSDPEAYARISEQIHKGGSGKWGPVIMPPFPMISEAETKALADWILTRK
jgi:cytochrome c551/c552